MGQPCKYANGISADTGCMHVRKSVLHEQSLPGTAGHEVCGHWLQSICIVCWASCCAQLLLPCAAGYEWCEEMLQMMTTIVTVTYAAWSRYLLYMAHARLADPANLALTCALLKAP